MSHDKPRTLRLDGERLVLVPILSVLFLGSALQIQGTWSSQPSPGNLNALHGLLTLVFYTLMIGLLIARKPSRTSGPSRRATVAAYAGTFAPFLLVWGGASSNAGATQTALAVVVAIVGLASSVYALGWLGRSFGVVPQARELVRSGPYRYVRHPLYVAELITFVGALLTDVRPYTLLVLAFFVAVQGYRAHQEEKVLRSVFPEYESYMAQAGRFTPRRQALARAS